MSTSTSNSFETLQVLLSAGAHKRVLGAILDALGSDAVDELGNAVRLLDRRVTGGSLRSLDEISAIRIKEPKLDDKVRVRLQQTACAFIRRAAREVLEARDGRSLQKILLAAAALDVLRAHGAIDILAEWLAREQARSRKGRDEKLRKTRAANNPLLKEVSLVAAKSQRSTARIAATNLERKKTGKTPTKREVEATRGRLRRNQPKTQ
jgi:hypothetical protein